MPQLDVVSSGGDLVVDNNDDLHGEPADDVLADLDLQETVPDDVAEYARVRVGETEESRTKLLAELEDMIYGKRRQPSVISIIIRMKSLRKIFFKFFA